MTKDDENDGEKTIKRNEFDKKWQSFVVYRE
jgi:hypothetical protein